MRKRDYDLIVRRSRECGFRSVSTYSTYVIVWNSLSGEEDLPTGFNYLRDKKSFQEAVRVGDKRVLEDSVGPEFRALAKRQAGAAA